MGNAQIEAGALPRLRDLLLAQAVSPVDSDRCRTLRGQPEDAFASAMLRRVAPLCELLYLVMSADGECSSRERQVLHGAARLLSNDRLSAPTIDALVDEFAREAAAVDLDVRLDRVAAWLSNDAVTAEAAYTLAAVMVVADRRVHQAERDLLYKLGERLGISHHPELCSEVGLLGTPAELAR